MGVISQFLSSITIMLTFLWYSSTMISSVYVFVSCVCDVSSVMMKTYLCNMSDDGSYFTVSLINNNHVDLPVVLEHYDIICVCIVYSVCDVSSVMMKTYL